MHYYMMDLPKKKCFDLFNRIVSLTATLTFISGSIATIVGGLMASLYLRLPFITLASIEVIIGLYMIFMVKEPERHRATTMRHATIKASRSMLTKPLLATLMLYTISVGVLSRIIFWSYQPMLLVVGNFGPMEMGVVFASINVVAAAGSFVMYRAFHRLRNCWMIESFLLVNTVLTFSLWIASDLFSLLITIYGFQIVRGMSRPYVTTLMQEQLSSEERSTFVSIDSFKNGVLFFVISVFLRNASVIFTLKFTLLAYIALIILTACSLLITSSRMNLSSRQNSISSRDF